MLTVEQKSRILQNFSLLEQDMRDIVLEARLLGQASTIPSK